MPQTPVILSPQPIRPRSTPVGSLFDNFVVRPATPLLPSASAKDTVWRDGQQAISSRSACRILYRACVLGSVDDITRVMDCHRFDKDSLRGPTLRAADGGFVNCVRCLTDRLSSDECSNFDELMVEVALVAVRRGDLDMLDLVVDVVCKHDTALFCEWVLPQDGDGVLHGRVCQRLTSLDINTVRKPNPSKSNRLLKSDPSSHPSKIHPSVQTNPSSTTKAKATVPNSAHRVSEPNHQRQRKTQPTSKPRPKEWLTLEHGQAARAEVIYKALKSYARFVGRSPRIYEIRDDKLTLRLPSYGLFSLVRGSGFLRPSREVVRQARETLLEDVQILHQLHIHWCPNLRYVRFQQESNTNILDPIIEGFNYAIDPSDDMVAWEEMARDRIQLLNNQFDVIEELASISPDTRQLPAVLPPDTVACMLSNYRKNDARYMCRDRDAQLILRCVKTYPKVLGDFVSVCTQYDLQDSWLPGRKELHYITLGVGHVYHLAEAAVRAHRAGLDSLQERTEDHRLLQESKKHTAESYHGGRFANMVWRRRGFFRLFSHPAIESTSTRGLMWN
ncbi:hypothetical protein PG995_004836 [Apiospora arundinis]